MPVQQEHIPLAADESFRLLRWSHSVKSVGIVRGGIVERIQGRGDHWHYHRASELTFIEHGSGMRFVADHMESFEDGDLVLIGANVPHYWHQHGMSSGLSLQWDFPMDHGIWSFGETVAPLRSLAASALRGHRIRGATARAAVEIMRDLQCLAGLPRLALFLRLIGMLGEAPARDKPAIADRPFALDGTAEHQQAIQRAVSYILAHYRDPIRLEILHELTNMSRSTFARQFHHHIGKPYSTFLNQVRLQAVCRALRETTSPVGTIALDHGFNQLSFFNRLFRREFAMSPTHFRKLATPAGLTTGA